MDRVAMTNMILLIDQIDDQATKNLYDVKFETPFLKDTVEFYNNESLRLLTENSAPDYIRKIHSRYMEE